MLQHETIKSLFLSAVQDVTSHIQDYTVRPGKDLSRTRKFPPEKLIRFLVAQGSRKLRAGSGFYRSIFLKIGIIVA